MRNSLFLIVVLSFFFTSCQEEVIAPTPFETSELTIADRTTNPEIEVTVESFSLQSGTVTVLLASVEDLTETVIEDTQTLIFDDNAITLSFEVNSYQSIDDNLEITFNLGGQNLSEYVLDGAQFIIIEDEEIN